MFFTTTLQNVVQTYSLKHSKLLNPSHSHPSPPTVFALSCTSHLLLSVSNFPPTIHLTNLLLNSYPMLLHPQCSSSTVVAAKFHPERANVFLLAFADGTCALYDASYMMRNNDKSDHQPGPSGLGASGEIAHIKRVHATANTLSASDLHSNNFRLGIENAPIGDRCIGITALALVPGRRAKAITVGADGKCCVIDFAVSDKEARILDSWYIQGPATSLSLLPILSNVSNRPKAQARVNARRVMRSDVLVTIGRQDGKVMIYDLHGNLLEERKFDPEDSRVIDVEWTRSNDSSSVKRAKSDHAVQQIHVPTRRKQSKIVDHPLAKKTASSSGIYMNEHLNYSHQFSSHERIDDRFIFESRPLTSALKHMDIFSQEKPGIRLAEKKKFPLMQDGKSQSSKITIKGERKSLDHGRTNVLSSETQTTRDRKLFSHKAPANQNLPPPLPARPAPQKWAQDSMGAPETKILSKLEVVGQETQLIDESMNAGTNRSLRCPALFAPYMKPTISTVTTGQFVSKTESPTNDDIAEASFPGPVEEDAWADVAPKSHRRNRKSPHEIPTKKSYRRGHRKSVSLQASLHAPSEASNDTVIEWSAASSRPAKMNPLLPHPLSISPRKPGQKPKQKNYLGLSQLPSLDDPSVQWSLFTMRPKLNIHADDSSPSPQISSYTSPNTSHSFSPRTVQPLTETTHNPKSPIRNPTNAPTRSPPRPPPPAAPLPKPLAESPSASPLPCACHQTNTHLQALKDELETQFLAQRVWFETKIRDMGARMDGLEEKNSRLKVELMQGREW